MRVMTAATVSSNTVQTDAVCGPARALGLAELGTPAALALAAVSGAVYATGFPPLSWSITPWLALAPLLVACASLSPARAFAAGMCWTGAAAAGVAWFLPGMLSGYFGLTTVSSWLANLALRACLHRIHASAYAAW